MLRLFCHNIYIRFFDRIFISGPGHSGRFSRHKILSRFRELSERLSSATAEVVPRVVPIMFNDSSSSSAPVRKDGGHKGKKGGKGKGKKGSGRPSSRQRKGKSTGVSGKDGGGAPQSSYMPLATEHRLPFQRPRFSPDVCAASLNGGPAGSDTLGALLTPFGPRGVLIEAMFTSSAAEAGAFARHHWTAGASPAGAASSATTSTAGAASPYSGTVFGLDLEEKPTFQKGQSPNGTALVQLGAVTKATESFVFSGEFLFPTKSPEVSAASSAKQPPPPGKSTELLPVHAVLVWDAKPRAAGSSKPSQHAPISDKTGSLPATLRTIFSSTQIKVCGMGIAPDLAKMAKDFYLPEAAVGAVGPSDPRVLDFTKLPQEWRDQIQLGGGLAGLATRLLNAGVDGGGCQEDLETAGAGGPREGLPEEEERNGVAPGGGLLAGHEIPKSKKISMSNWEKRPLEDRQLVYAVLDAFASCAVGEHLLAKFGNH